MAFPLCLTTLILLALLAHLVIPPKIKVPTLLQTGLNVFPLSFFMLLSISLGLAFGLRTSMMQSVLLTHSPRIRATLLFSSFLRLDFWFLFNRRRESPTISPWYSFLAWLIVSFATTDFISWNLISLVVDAITNENWPVCFAFKNRPNWLMRFLLKPPTARNPSNHDTERPYLWFQ